MNLENKILLFANASGNVVVVNPLRAQLSTETDSEFLNSMQQTVPSDFSFAAIVDESTLPPDHQESWEWDASTQTLSVNAAANLAIDKLAAKELIDSHAESARLRYITPGSGQSLVYQDKLLDAEEYIAAGYPADVSSHPWIDAEATALGITPQATADNIVANYNTWKQIGIEVEKIRLVAKRDIDASQTAVEVEQIKNATAATLDAI